MYSFDDLKELIKILDENDLTSIKLSDESGSVSIEKAPARPPMPAPAMPLANQAVCPEQSNTQQVQADLGKTIDSPMVGVFYAAPNPDSEPFVSVGQTVKKGDIVCIIEAMKIMNEIAAEESGTITEILINNGDVVEYGQPMFKIS